MSKDSYSGTRTVSTRRLTISQDGSYTLSQHGEFHTGLPISTSALVLATWESWPASQPVQPSQSTPSTSSLATCLSQLRYRLLPMPVRLAQHLQHQLRLLALRFHRTDSISHTPN